MGMFSVNKGAPPKKRKEAKETKEMLGGDVASVLSAMGVDPVALGEEVRAASRPHNKEVK